MYIVLCVHVWCSVMGPCVWYDVCVCVHVMCVVDLCVGWCVCMCVCVVYVCVMGLCVGVCVCGVPVVCMIVCVV